MNSRLQKLIAERKSNPAHLNTDTEVTCIWLHIKSTLRTLCSESEEIFQYKSDPDSPLITVACPADWRYLQLSLNRENRSITATCGRIGDTTTFIWKKRYLFHSDEGTFRFILVGHDTEGRTASNKQEFCEELLMHTLSA